MSKKQKFNAQYIGKDQHASPVSQELPVGFGMSLSQHTEAMNYFGTLDDSQRNKVISYIQGATSGADARQRIDNAVQMLTQQDIDFIQ